LNIVYGGYGICGHLVGGGIKKMEIIDKIIMFGIFLTVGSLIQEKTMDMLYPNRPKGIINNYFYNKRKEIKK
jgi:hypothetical protein